MKSTLAKGLVALMLTLSIIIIPVIMVGAVVEAPIRAINDFFQGLGDFFSSDPKENEVLILIDMYLESNDGQDMIRNKYKVLSDEYGDDVDTEEKEVVQEIWLIIPNILAGMEEVSDEQIQLQIELIKENEYNLYNYLDDLRNEEPWKTEYEGISTSTVESYVKYYTGYLGIEGSLDASSVGKYEFLYPLQTKAVVTSEFGYRGSITTGAGTSGNHHTGIDLAYNGGDATTCGVPIYASMPGKVVQNDRTFDQYGANWGAVEYENIQVWYVHLLEPFPYPVGAEIKKGDFVGYIGSSGLSTACHLHLEIRVDRVAVNPRNFLNFD